MKRLICLLLLVFAAGLCMPVMAEELLYGEREGWHFYPGHPTLSTLLEKEDFWIVRAVCTEKDTETNAAVPRYTCRITDTLRGDKSGELKFNGERFVDPDLYCGPNNGLARYALQVGKEYIFVLDRYDYTDGVVPHDPDMQSIHPTVAFWCSNGLYSNSNSLRNEIKAEAEINSLDDLEAFFRANLPEDTDWQKPLLIACGTVFSVVWLGLMGWVLYKRKRNME